MGTNVLVGGVRSRPAKERDTKGPLREETSESLSVSIIILETEKHHKKQPTKNTCFTAEEKGVLRFLIPNLKCALLYKGGSLWIVWFC